MAKRQQHSDQFKAEALAALDANGGNVSKTARELGIGRSTLKTWRDGMGVHPEVAEIRQHKKQHLADRLEAIAHRALDGLLDRPDDYYGGFRERMTGVAIAIDKVRLLRGQGEDAREGLDAFLEATEAGDVE